MANATIATSHSDVNNHTRDDSMEESFKKEPANNFSRRNRLLEIQKKVQSFWEDNHSFEVDAPQEGEKVYVIGSDPNSPLSKEKFFTNFPYPYLNGRIHLGHAFSATKCEFASRFQRLCGKKVLFPFSFHATGMPIPAAADRLRREIEEYEEIISEEKAEKIEEQESFVSEDVSKFSSKRSKATAKISQNNSQWNIMKMMNLTEDEIPKFKDASYWITYFMPLAIEDLKALGMSIDWRRSFVTTDLNPIYDKFIRWQFRTLKKKNKVKFGTRCAVFSRLEHQPCADHDRLSGENVVPQQYTLMKLTVKEVPEKWADIVGSKKLVLLAATLRPETMYGQTNVFVHPDETYGFFYGFENPKTDENNHMVSVFSVIMTPEKAKEECPVIYVCSERSAANMAYQGIVPVYVPQSKELPAAHCAYTLKGKELFGLPLHCPDAFYETVYCLPMLTISINKGTGIVTSVPSDAPDDYAMLVDMKKKINYYKTTYGVQPEWITPYDVVDIIEIPGVSTRYAVDLYHEKKVQSPKDVAKLKEIKDITYREGYYKGVMYNGKYAGMLVSEAKPKITQDLIDKSEALSYYETEQKVVSRSHEECIVALCDQWYLDYGEENWRNGIENHISNPNDFTTYNPNTFNQFKNVFSWLTEWACSRQYGLGTKLPWEEEKGNIVYIESLSDSTIYMALYTIYHLIANDPYASENGPFGITPEDLNDQVFDYIFKLSDEYPAENNISHEHLDMLRHEFSFWYPFDMRASGKDLIFNHLTFALYNHAAIWDDPAYWPRSMYCNGHVQVNAQKMSKSAGNFLILEDVISKFSSDGARVAMADAGDSLDDANFSSETAFSAVMKMYLFEQFVKDVLDDKIPMREGELQLSDEVFINEMIRLTNQAFDFYQSMQIRNALKCAFYEFQAAKDIYKMLCVTNGMHKQTIEKYIETYCIIMSPITPHLNEYIWTFLLKKPYSINKALWPEFKQQYNNITARKYQLVLKAVEEFRKIKDKITGSKKGRPVGPLKFTRATISISKAYLPWQAQTLNILGSLDINEKIDFSKDITPFLQAHFQNLGWDNSSITQALAFANFQIKEEFPHYGHSIFDLEMPFDEGEIFIKFKDYICNSLGIQDFEVKILDIQENEKKGALTCTPGKPIIVFE